MNFITIAGKEYPLVFGMEFLIRYGKPKGYTKIGHLDKLLGDMSLSELPLICKLGIENAKLIYEDLTVPAEITIKKELAVNLTLAMKIITALNGAFIEAMGEKVLNENGETETVNIESQKEEQDDIKN